MLKRLLPMWTDIGRGRMPADDIDQTDVNARLQWGPIRWLILCGVALIATILIGTVATVGEFRERAIRNSERELENTVRLLTRHFDQQFEDTDIIANDLISKMQFSGIASPETFKNQMSTLDAHLMLKSQARALSYIGDVNIFDSDGHLINSSGGWPLPDVNIADRAFFKAFKSDPESKVTLAEPVRSVFTSKWTTVIAHRLSGPKGIFLGVMAQRIDPVNFEDFFASVSLGEGAAISMLHRDGTLLARYPHADSMIGQKFKRATLLNKVLTEGGQRTLRVRSPVDSEDRLGSAAELSHFPIVVVATTSVVAALADWRGQTRFLFVVAILFTLAISFIMFFIIRRLSRQHKISEQRLTLEKQRLDTAVNNMSQGLLMFDSSQRLVVCNRRYIEIYCLSPDVIKPGCTFRDIITHRKETGSFVGDIDKYCSNVIHNVALETDVIVKTSGGRSIQISNRQIAGGGWVATHEDVTERRRADEKIAYLAHYDALTDLPNRVLFREQVERELRRTSRGEQFALLYIDIDEFKGINDSLGHHVGDELLKAVATRLRSCIRETDIVARLGGDEFAVIQTDVGGADDVVEFVARIHEAIR